MSSADTNLKAYGVNKSEYLSSSGSVTVRVGGGLLVHRQSSVVPFCLHGSEHEFEDAEEGHNVTVLCDHGLHMLVQAFDTIVSTV